MKNVRHRLIRFISFLSMSAIIINSWLLMLPVEAAEGDDLFVYGTYTVGHDVSGVEGYGNLLYYDSGDGIAHVVQVDIVPGTGNREFTEIGSYAFRADIDWTGNDSGGFYIDKDYIYYGAGGGIAKWQKNPDGTFGQYLGPLNIPIREKNETLAYDAESEVWYTATSSRAVYSYREGVDKEWVYEFTYTSYGKGQGNHGGMEFVGGYLWVSETKTDVIGQWQQTGNPSNNGWAEVNTFTYTMDEDVHGIGFGPLGHFWVGSGPAIKNKTSVLYEVGGGPVAAQVDFSYSPPSAGEGTPIVFENTSSFWPDRIISLEWKFDDGTSTTVENPVHLFGDNGSIPVTLSVVTSNGNSANITKNITINNVAPVVDAGPDKTINEGSPLTFSGSYTDPGWLDTHVVTWSFADGTSASNVLNPTHKYGNNGVYTANLTVTDDDGATSTDNLTITVNNVAPIVEAGPDRTAEEGEVISFSMIITDPGWIDTHTYTITWGDGTFESGSATVTSTGSIINVNHAYERKGKYSADVTVYDSDGASTKDTVNIFVPVGIALSVSPNTVPNPANSQSIDLKDIPLQDIPLQDIPLQDIPLQDINLQGTPLQDIPLQDIPLQDIPLQDITWEEIIEGTSLEGTPLQDIPLQDIFLAGIPLQDITLADIMLAALPLQDITINGVPLQDILLAGTPLQDIPLQDIPLQDIDITGTPLQDIPLQDIPLQDIPLQDIVLGTPLQDIPLQDIPLQDIILAGIPLRYVDLDSTPLQDIPLQDISIYGVPLQDILLGTPLQDIPLQDISIWELAMASIPLQDIYVGGIPLQDIPLQDIPLQDIPLQDILLGTPLQDIPLQDITLGDLAMAAAPLQDITINGIPLQDIPLQDITLHGILQDIPLQDIPLQDIRIDGVPLQDIPLQDIPLQDITWEFIIYGTPLQDIPLQDITLQDVFLSGIPLQDITLLDIVLGQVPLQDITIWDILLAMIPLQDIPWESVPLQDIPIQEAFVEQDAVTYTITLANYGDTPANDVWVTHALPDGFVYVPGSTSGATDEDPVIVGTQLTWGVFNVSSGNSLTLSFQVNTPVTLGTFYSSVSATGSIDIPSSTTAAPVTVTDTFEENDTWETATDITDDSLYFSYISSPGDVDWYRIPVPEERNTTVSVYLSHLPDDFDMVLFAGNEDLPTDIPLQDIPLQDIPLQDIPLQDIPLQDIPLQDIPLQDIPLQDIPLQDIPLQDIPLQDISFERGTTNEFAADKVVNETGYYYIMVSGFNGATSNEPYVLRVKTTPPLPIEPVIRTFEYSAGPAGTAYEPYGVDTETIIITNVQRLRQYFGAEADTLVSELASFANLENVKGMILPVDSYASVNNTYTAWDVNAGDPEAANTVAASIRFELHQVLNDHPKVKYVVIAGSDEIIPFKRVPDEVYLSNESTYASQAHLTSSALYASLVHGYILTDDYYVDMAPVPWMGRELYVPDYANGRLVETPNEIIGILQEFQTSGGVLNVSTSMVTGYDFLTDGAESIAEALTALGIIVNTDLINDYWTAAELTALLLANPGFDLVSLNSHFNHWALGPATGEPFYDSGIAVSYLEGKLVFSMGCHSGLNVDDSISEPGPWSLDWPQAFAQEVSWYIGNTGYGYGDSDIVALTEELMLYFAEDLGSGSPQAVGQSLLNAKQRYFMGMGSYGPFDEKILIESTLYGLPMYQVNMVPVNPPTPVSGIPATVNVNRYSGSALIDSLSQETQLVAEASAEGTIYSADGQNQFIPYRPVQPVTDLDITYPGMAAHGALFTGGTYVDEYPFDPVIARPVDDQTLTQYEPQIINEGWYPAKLHTINSLSTADAVKQNLIVTLGQFVTTSAADKVTGIQRLYTSQNYNVYYSNSSDFTAPVVEQADINIQGTTPPYDVSFNIQARDINDPLLPDDGNIQKVLVTWTYTDTGTAWESIELSYVPASGTWVGSLSGLDGNAADFIVQVVDTAGNTGFGSAKGFFYTPIPTEVGNDQTVDEGEVVTLVGSSNTPAADITWYFGDGTTATGAYTQSHVYTDDGVYTAVLKVSDGEGGSGWDSQIVNVRNVAPSVQVMPDTTITYTDPVLLTGNFFDPGSADTHHFQWDIRTQGSPESLITAWGNTELAINWLEWLPDYPAPGTYVATLTVQDDDGGIGQDDAIITIVPKDTVISSPSGEVTYGSGTTIEVTLTDIDGYNLLHQSDSPKMAQLEYRVDSVSPWTIISSALLATPDDSGSALNFQFSIPESFLAPAGTYELRAIFTGDLYYNGSVSEIGSLVVHRQPILIGVTSVETLPLETVTLEAIITDIYGIPIPAGPYTFQFSVDSTIIGSAEIYPTGYVYYNWSVSTWPAEAVEFVTIIVNVIPNGFITAANPGIGTITIISPQALKSGVIPLLETAKTGDPQVDSVIDIAISGVQESLEASLWLDSSNIEVKFGKKVFQSERNAVESLLSLITSDPVNAYIYNEAIADLIKADELITKIIITQAQTIIVDDVALQQEIQSHITTALVQLAEAQMLTATNPIDAITKFMQAWDSAQQVFLLVK